MHQAPAKNARSSGLISLLVACVMVAANLFEPLTVDDCCHHYYARQVAHHPTQPFEFDTVWHQRPAAAWTIMVAPVNSYYWAPGIRLAEMFPQEWWPVIWHLWYLPVYWLFCFSLLSLLNRWLKRGSVAVLCVVALGPFVLPGLNLMLEVPMLSLGLASMMVLLRSFDRHSASVAVFAGVLLGFALQLKYSAMAFFPPWFLLAVFRRRWREWLIGMLAAAAVALAIEGLISWSHDGGGSYFAQQLRWTQMRSWGGLTKGMFVQVGVLGLTPLLLALIGLRAPRWVAPVVVAVHVAGYVLVAAFPDTEGRSLSDGALDSMALLAMGATTWLGIGLLYAKLLWTGLGGVRRLRVHGSRAVRIFLAGWFVTEIISSFAVSPFPAARRVMMVLVSFTVAAGWLAVRRAGAMAAVRAVAVGAVAMGLAYQTVDYLEGRSWVQAADAVVDYHQEHADHGLLYYTGGWGFEYYAPAAGMQPFVEATTELQAGDLIACGSIDGVEEPWFWDNDPATLDQRLELVTTMDFGTDPVPLSTQFGYYSGQRPIDGQLGPRFVVRVLLAKERLHANELGKWHDPWFSRGNRPK